MDEAAKQRLRVKEESCKAYIVEELSLRKRRKEIHQARPWRRWAAGEWCWCWRSGKHKGSRMKSCVFLCPARALLQERETSAEGVRTDGVVWITEGTYLVRYAVQHLQCNTCVPFRVRDKIVQYLRHRKYEHPRTCQTFATQHVP